MKGYWKFAALAVAGFALGAGAALLHMPRSAPPASLEQKLGAKTASATPEAKPVPAQAAKTPPGETTKTDTTATDDGLAAPPAQGNTSTGAAPAKTAAGTGTGKPDDTLTSAATPEETSAPASDAASPQVEKNIAAAKGEPPTAGVGGAFSLIDDNGNPVTDKSWPGKYLLVFFGFTNCPDICPVTLDKLTGALDQLGDDASKVQTLFITMDAARDKPNVLKDYVGHFHKSILGLTGTDAQLQAVAKEYKVYSSRHDSRNGHDYTYDHSAFVYFMAPDGQLAEVIDSDAKATDIADRVRPYLEGKKQVENPAP